MTTDRQQPPPKLTADEMADCIASHTHALLDLERRLGLVEASYATALARYTITLSAAVKMLPPPTPR